MGKYSEAIEAKLEATVDRMIADGEKGTLTSIACHAAARAALAKTEILDVVALDVETGRPADDPYLAIVQEMAQRARVRFAMRTDGELEFMVELFERHLARLGYTFSDAVGGGK